MVLNAQIGNQGVVSELKVTNKQFRSVNSYCEDKGQCAQFNVETKVNTVCKYFFTFKNSRGLIT